MRGKSHRRLLKFMTKRGSLDRGLTLKEIMQVRETLERLWPDLQKPGEWFKAPEKLALHIPEWVMAAGFLVGMLLNTYVNYFLFRFYRQYSLHDLPGPDYISFRT